MTARWAATILGVAALGTLLHWPGLGAGFALDDYLQLAMLDGRYAVARAPWDLYSFVDGTAGDLAALQADGTMPWWSDPEARFKGLRPLTSLLTSLDHRLFGYDAIARHVHSLAWWTAVVVAVLALFRRLLPRQAGLLAAAIFAVDPAHVVPVAWLANRSALVSVLFGVVAIGAHARWRLDAWRPGGVVSAVAFALALAGGEYGLAMFAYLVAFAFIADQGTWRQRALSILPATVVTLAYVGLHVVFDYGAVGSSGYLDPLTSPGDFALHTTVRFPALLVNEFLTIPSELTHLALVLGHWASLVLLAPLAIFAALLPGAMRRMDPSDRKYFSAFAVGTVLSLVPLLPSVPSGRLLVGPSVGGSAVLAMLLWDAWRRVRARDRWTSRIVARGGACAALAFAHVLAAPAATRLASQMWADAQNLTRTRYLAAEMDWKNLGEQHVFLLNALDPSALISPPHVWHVAGRDAPRGWHLLTMTPHSVRVRRVRDDVLELATDGKAMLEVPTAWFFRSASRPFDEGSTTRTERLDVQVFDVKRWGPARIRYHFDGSADSPRNVFLMLTPAGVRRAQIPKVGAESSLPSVAEWAEIAKARP